MKKMNSNKILTLLVVLFITSCGYAQISVTHCNGETPQQVIDKVIKGNGVTITNVKFNGNKGVLKKDASVQLGTFTNNEDGFPKFFHSGIILCSGDCKMAEGPNNVNGKTARVSYTTEYKCKELNKIVRPRSVNFPAVLEFDFSSVTNHIRFRYVFATEEYPEFSCSPYNDVFGFFVTDPKTGKTKNIALIPGTKKAVSVNNIHPAYGSGCKAVHSKYLTMLPQGSPKMQFDGYVGPFEAVVDLEPNKTYHIKLAISNVSDRDLESAVFIEAMSFNAVDDRGFVVGDDGSTSTYSQTDSLNEKTVEGITLDELKNGGETRGIALKELGTGYPIDLEHYTITAETDYDYYIDSIYAEISNDSVTVTLHSRGQWCDCFFPENIPVRVVLTPKAKGEKGKELHRIVLPILVPITERSPWLSRCLWVLLTIAGLGLMLFYLWGLLKKNRFKKSAWILEQHQELKGSIKRMTEWKKSKRLREKSFIAWLNRWFVPFRDERRKLNWPSTVPPGAGSITFVAGRSKETVLITRNSITSKLKMAGFDPNNTDDKRTLLDMDPISVYNNRICEGGLKYDSEGKDDEKYFRIIIGALIVLTVSIICVLAFLTLNALL